MTRCYDLVLCAVLTLLFLTVASASAPAPDFLCTDAEGARLLFRAACAHSLACRFEVIDNARVGSTAQWFTILSDRIDDILFNATSRAELEPAAWLDTSGTYVGVDALLGQNCSALAATSDAPPLAFRAAVMTFVEYQNYVAEDGQCSDLNTVAEKASDGTITCQCLPDKVCEPTGERRANLLLTGISALTIVAEVGAFVAVLIIALRNVTLDA